ncbi:MAG: hypothetical protein ABIO86_04885 [Sphingomonas sp.]
MPTDKWAVTPAQLDCYNTFRSRIEAEDRWIVARIQIVVLSQGFLFSGLGALGQAILRSGDGAALKGAGVISVIGLMIGLFGAWGVQAAVSEIAKLKVDYELVQIKPLNGLPDLHAHPVIHNSSALRAIGFSYLLCATWLLMLVYIVSRL